MKKIILLAVFLPFTASTFCQWTQGYVKDEFGDKTNKKFIAFTTRNGSFTKEGKTVVNKSTLLVNTKLLKSQGDDYSMYNLCFEFFENGGGNVINSTTVYDAQAELLLKLADGSIVSSPIFATERDLRIPIDGSNYLLIELLQKEKNLIRSIVKIDYKHTIARYSFIIDPNGFTTALNKHIESESPPSHLKTTVKFTAPVITDEPIEESDIIESRESVGQKTQDTLSTSLETNYAPPINTVENQSADSTEKIDQEVVIEEKPVYGVEQMPQFPGGDEELLRFVKDNLRYPKVAADVGIEGRVTMRFVVNRDGDVTDITVIRGLDPACDKEAVRVVKMMPRWTPGRQNGRNVPVYYTLPVVYKLQK